MKQIEADHLRVGRYGEEIAARHLKRKGHEIVETNYRKKWGEIDIVSRETSGMIHFVEVKAVSYETRVSLEIAVTRRTWRPEDNVHDFKLKKLSRAIESWIAENEYEGDWQIDVIAIRLVPSQKYASLKFIENIIIGS